VKIHGSYTHLNQNSYNFSKIHRKERILLENAKSIIAISKYSRKTIIKHFNPKVDVRVIHNGLSIIEPQTDTTPIKDHLVVFAGSISKNKGVKGLLDAWKTVIQNEPECRLLIFGSGNPEYISKLKSEIDPEIRNTIEFKGFVDYETLLLHYTKASCAVFPSFTENLSMAPIEAMSVACPTIFTRYTSGPEIIDEGIDGLLVDPDNQLEISEAILRLVRDRDLAKKLGSEGRKKVMEKFDIRNVADQHIRLYKKILKQS
jgi:glycosyltransferase involved in cell wall biosynthesis